MRRAGIALAREVERRAPDAVTTSWWKEERGKRIFIDFNQNARDRTFASAYSVRRTAIATVSTPLTWDELAAANPDDYTIATVADLVASRDDPWADIDEVDQSIEPLLEMVAADEERGLGDLPYPPNYSGKWVCAGVSSRTKMRSGLRCRGALRCRPSKDVDSADNHSRNGTGLHRRRDRSGTEPHAKGCSSRDAQPAHR